MNKLMNASILGFLLILTACSQISSSEVDASAIYGELSLKRSEGSSQATASATFFVGGPTGTVVQMESPASVTINGQSANEVTDPIINMTSYQATVSGSASLVYTDKNGTSYTNSLFMPGSISETVPGTAFISQGFTLNYMSTTGFVPGEQLEITLSGINNGNIVDAALITGATSGSANISGSALNGFSPGSLTVSICRQSYPAAQAPYPKGTSVSIQSCSNPRTVNLQP